MKHIIFIIFCCFLVLSSTACTQQTNEIESSTTPPILIESATPTPAIPVELSEDNILEYIKFDISVENFNHSAPEKDFFGFTSYDYSFNLKISISSLGAYTFEKVKFDVDWEPQNSLQKSLYDEFWLKSNKMSFTLGQSGLAEQTQSITGRYDLIISSPRINTEDLLITNISGNVYK